MTKNTGFPVTVGQRSIRALPTWDGREVQQTQSCGAAATTTLTAIPAGARRVVFSVLGDDTISIHNNAAASAHEGVAVGGTESDPLQFHLDPDDLPTFYAENEEAGAVILGVTYFFQ